MPGPTAIARNVMTLAPLADVRTLIAKHLPEHMAARRPNSTKRQPATTPPKLRSRCARRCRLRVSNAGRSDAYLVGSGGDSAIRLSLRVVRFEQTHVDNARQTSSLIGVVGQAIMTVPKNDKFKDYARYAEHCLNMVAATRDQESRSIQREMAAEWLRLADTVRRPRRSKQMQMG
jgi:hypothetical protein